MIKSYWLLFFLFSSILPLASFAQGPSHASYSSSEYAYQFKFIKNKGQFNSPILYKTEIPSGNLFIENNRLVYDFKDLSSINPNHGHGAAEDPNWRNKPIKSHCFFVNFIHSNPNSIIEETGKFEEYHNYYLGNDATKWASGVPLFANLSHKNLYPNIDMHSGSSDGKLKFEFVVKKSGKPNDIQLEYEGLEKMQIKKGELYLYTSLGQIVEEKPYAYQIINGEEVEIECNYILENQKLRFDFPKGYNTEYELIIDPTLIFSTYSGSFSDNFGVTATYDSEGFLYSASLVFGASGLGFPTTAGAYQAKFSGGAGLGGTDINVSKYDTSGSKRIYSTYLGGTEDEMPHSMVVNSRDELYVFGTTGSKDFPTDSNSYQSKMNNPSTSNRINFPGLGLNYTFGSDLFVFKFSADGKKRLASTFLGGSKNDGVNDTIYVRSHTLRYNYADEIRGEIDIDNDDNIYVATCTNSPNFPMVGNSFDTTFNGGGQDGIIIKLTNNLDSVLWSSYLGGKGKDAIYSLAIDRGNNIYVTGGTTSKDTVQFKTGSNKNHLVYGGGRADGFITHIKADGSSIINSTYYGTKQYDQIYFVELDRKGFVYIYGQTEDTTDFFLKNAAYGKSKEGVFISKLGSKLDTTYWSTLIGRGGNKTTLARPQLAPSAFLVDICNSIYFSGWGGGVNNLSLGGNYAINNNFSSYVTGMDVTSNAYKKTTTGHDFYLGALSSDASSLTYGSFFGGDTSEEHVDGGTSRFDKKGIIYQSVCAGCGGNSDFPIKAKGTAVSRFNRSNNCNNAVFKMDFKPPSIIAEFQIPRKICLKDSVQLKNLSKVMKTPQYYWDFGNGNTSTQSSPKIYFDSAKTYFIRLVVIDTSSCNYSDTIIKKVAVEFPKPARYFQPDSICIGSSILLGANLNPNYNYLWTPGKTLNDSTLMNPAASPVTNTTYKLTVKTEICTDTFYQFIKVDSLITASFTFPDSICIPDSISMKSAGFVTANTKYNWSVSRLSIGTNDSLNLELNTKGNYKIRLIVSDPFSCNKADTSEVDITALSDSSYVLSDKLSCNHSPVALGIVKTSGYSYKWIPSTGLDDTSKSNPTANPGKDVNYTLIVDRGVCTDTVYQKLLFDSISLQTTNDTDICITSKAIRLTGNSRGLAKNIIWSNYPDFSDTIASTDSSISRKPVVFKSVFYARAISRRGCEATDSTIIRVNNFGIRADSARKICLGDTIQISVVSLIPNDTLLPIWKPYEFIIGRNDTSHILVNPPKDKIYRVDVENRIKCLITDSVFVKVSGLDLNGNLTSSNDTILKNQSSELKVTPEGYTYKWTPREGLSNSNSSSTTASPDTTTTYEVEVYDENNENCRFKRSVTVVVEELHCEEPWLFIPNSFSPNNDGANDVFYFRGKHIATFSMEIYNRWGELLFKTNDSNAGWDGTYKGQISQADVYVYLISATCLDGQVFEKKGDVTLIH